MIRINQLSRHYGDFAAVDDVSFEIGRGEVVGLLGHNGAGKTTIMKMMTGYLEPTSGVIEIDGFTMGEQSREIQQRIGYLPENCPVWPEMTVIDYLLYQASLHGVPNNNQQAAVAQVIQRTALQEKATATIQTLSRGYRQRVGVAQAILHQPAIIILDEPTNGLDPTQIHQMRALIQELAHSATVILSTHILQEVQAVCERVLIMRAGQLVMDARLDALQASQQLLISLDNKKAIRYLKKVPGVGAVKRCESPAGAAYSGYLVEAEPELAPTLVKAIQEAGDNLYGLQTEVRNLETVFAEVNSQTQTNAGQSTPSVQPADTEREVA